jgi:hypothetical protein
MDKIEIEREYIECDCSSKCHLVVAEFDPEFGMTLFYQHCNWKGFWKRVWTAIKYVFQVGRDHSMGWDCTTMNEENCQKMQRMLDLAKASGYGSYWKELKEREAK